MTQPNKSFALSQNATPGMKKICIAFTCSFDCNSLNSLFSFKQRIKEVPSMAIKAITLFLVCLFCLADGKGISLPQSNGLILVNIATEISAMIHPSIAQNNVFFQPEISKLIEKQICKDKWKTKKCKRQKLRNRCKRKKVAKKCKETCQKCPKITCPPLYEESQPNHFSAFQYAEHRDLCTKKCNEDNRCCTKDSGLNPFKT